jgi:hypothetical protein
LGINQRLNGNKVPADWESEAGYLGKWWPAHHRIKAENPYVYGINVNSRIAVTPAVAATEWPSRGVQLAHCRNVFFGQTDRTRFIGSKFWSPCN